ncbi:MAG: hypothetical protein J7J98_03580 [candidate division Zixibacteria bacterium]|nr:hypothetical protein [candidate division Zixibacteria bacterium]
MDGSTVTKVAILWHMHQPNYREPHSGRMAMPWVRLHALKDYLDMPLTAAARDEIKVTFNLVPSLIDQLQAYQDGGVDRHLELSRFRANDITDALKREILGSFFCANPTRMIVPYARYRQLYNKYSTVASEPGTLVNLFSSEEIRDLQVWSNLAWVDPMFRNEDPICSLIAKGLHFSEEEKDALLDWQLGLISRIIPTYQKLQDEGRLEVSFTPYYHPILPLLCDTNIATEALPSIELPEKRFVHPEDAEKQIAMAIEQYRALFGRELEGLWPSEGSVSEEVADMVSRMGIKWMATDEEVLAHSLSKSGLRKRDNPIHRVYEYPTGLKLLFRDHALSDRLGFVYSSWDATKAVDDFVGHIKRLGKVYASQSDQAVIPIILDGENAWEYFPDDGTEFLNLLYDRLADDPTIETITLGEAARTLTPQSLPKLFAGSWINHNFRVWIGHSEDNAAWNLLSRTRNDLVEFEKNNPGFDPNRLAQAWKQIYIAEGSDWCWWYGDDHHSDHDDQFDLIYRLHLAAVYEFLGMEVPLDHLRPIHTRSLILQAAMPDSLVSPQIDGRLTYFYEWAGAGHFECRQSGKTMHQVARQITDIYFAYDYDRFYIRLDFRSKNELKSMIGLKAELCFHLPESRIFMLDLSVGNGASTTGDFEYVQGDVLEFAVRRDSLWPDGFGELSFVAGLTQNDQRLECWPEHESIKVLVPRKHEEMFWPT